MNRYKPLNSFSFEELKIGLNKMMLGDRPDVENGEWRRKIEQEIDQYKARYQSITQMYMLRLVEKVDSEGSDLLYIEKSHWENNRKRFIAIGDEVIKNWGSLKGKKIEYDNPFDQKAYSPLAKIQLDSINAIISSIESLIETGGHSEPKLKGYSLNDVVNVKTSASICKMSVATFNRKVKPDEYNITKHNDDGYLVKDLLPLIGQVRGYTVERRKNKQKDD